MEETGKASAELTEAPTEQPRENMISTAVRFLQNPKVQQSPLSQRKAFLEKKGLTKQEIDLAIERSGTPNVETIQTAVPSGGQMTNYVSQPPQVVVAPVSTLSRVKDYIAYLIIASGASYGLYQLIKKYVIPYLYGPTPQDEKLVKLEEAVLQTQQSLNETMSKLQETLSSLQVLVKSQGDSIKVVSEQITSARGPVAMAQIQESQSANEIKDEIRSLKGLLLSRKQFPPAPSTTPVLPAWQRSSPAVADDKKKTGAISTPEKEADPIPDSSVTGQIKDNDHINPADNADSIVIGAKSTQLNGSEVLPQLVTDETTLSCDSEGNPSSAVISVSKSKEQADRAVSFNVQNEEPMKEREQASSNENPALNTQNVAPITTNQTTA